MTSHMMDHMHGESTDQDQVTTPPDVGSADRDQLFSPGMCDPRDRDAGPTCGVHNQMMVGVETIYLSHLPMFMFDPHEHPHRFQVILEVVLNGPGNPQAIYARDRRGHLRERMYTMSPDPFEMVELDPQHPRRNFLSGSIFRGHLERGGEEIISRAEARIVNTVYFHEFEQDAQPLEQLEYLLFGKAPDLFLAHVIIRPPDFDQIIGVTISGGALMDDDLTRGIHIKIPGRANNLQSRIKPQERVKAEAKMPGAQAGLPLELELEAGTEFYFEEGELRSEEKFTMDPTPEERKAGF